jgi:hypothetical protein
MDMNDSTVNIADFRGIREIKRRNAHNTPRSTKSNFGFLVLETPSVYCAREPESWNGSAQSASPAVVDIGELREARRFGHRFSIESHVSQRGAKVLHFSNFSADRETANSVEGEHRGIWNGITDDPDSPSAA